MFLEYSLKIKIFYFCKFNKKLKKINHSEILLINKNKVLYSILIQKNNQNCKSELKKINIISVPYHFKELRLIIL